MEKSFRLEKFVQEKINYTKCIYVLFTSIDARATRTCDMQ